MEGDPSSDCLLEKTKIKEATDLPDCLLVGSQTMEPSDMITTVTEDIKNFSDTEESSRARQAALTQADSKHPSSCISCNQFDQFLTYDNYQLT